MKKILFISFLSATVFLHSQELRSPSEFLGYELGSRFTWHHRVVDYFNYLAQAAPDRIQLQEYGKSFEGRPLLLAFISSSENMEELENIRQEHLKSTTGRSNASKAIVWLSYNVHGNESVSTEAAMKTIFSLLTSKQDYLKNTVVIIDPCINPDGRDRYVNWYKQFRNVSLQTDPNSKEHHEGWPSGRGNHYMFDLNRDWAWLTQVESRQRQKRYNEWLPHIHVDFHEQGIDDPYYFAPATEPFHEVITDFQRRFQVTLGKNHARYFDEYGWLYFTREIFDLFYPSYGDTYPTFNGSIGMTYEQGGGGAAGIAVNTSLGDTLTLSDRIAHHYTTSISTIEVASRHAEDLNDEYRKYYRNRNYRFKSYILKGNRDKLDALSQLLDAHEIIYGSGKGNQVKGFQYKNGGTSTMKSDAESLVVSTEQPKGTLVKVLFEPDAILTDSVTYDITAWSLPYAYGLDALASENMVPALPYQRLQPEFAELDASAYAYITDWDSMKDAQFLSTLIRKGVRVRHASTPFTIDGRTFAQGSLIILRADNKQPGFLNNLKEAQQKHSKMLIPTVTGFVEEGKDFGSESVKVIQPPRVAVLGGEPTNTLDFGEVWYFFEQQLDYPLSVIHSDYLSEISLSEYDVLILPGGSQYGRFYNKPGLQRLNDWVEKGGRLIAMGGAIKGLAGKNGFKIREREVKSDSSLIEIEPYVENYRESLKDEITGAIFKTQVDSTHPLAFGYGDTYYSLKIRDDRYEYLDEGTVVYLDENVAPIAGFAGSEARKNRAQTMIFGVEDFGAGHVIYLADNPLFRGFWENGKLFFANALFMIH